MALAQSNKILYVPAPTGGLNGSDPWYDMDEKDAVAIQNVNPLYNYSKCRLSFAAVGAGSGVASDSQARPLFSNIATDKTFSFVTPINGRLYTVTSAGAWTNQMAYSRTNFLSCQFRGKLFIANGTNTPVDWSGTVFTNPTGWTGTGLTASDLKSPWVYKERLFFTTAANDVWYAPIDAITGALTKLPMQSKLTRGGQIVFGGQTFSPGETERSALWVLVTSEGEVIVYSGQDPAASDWQFYGRYYLSKPLSYASFFNYAGDFHIITAQGIVAMSDVLADRREGANYITISKKIDPLIGSFAVGVGSSLFDSFPISGAVSTYENLLYVGPIPISIYPAPANPLGAGYFVMNLATKAWSWYVPPLTSYGISTPATADGIVYYIGNGTNFELWKTGQSSLYDVGGSNLPIEWFIASAFTNDRGAYNKKFNKIRPIVKNVLSPTIGAYIDFDTTLKTNAIATPLTLNKKFYDINVEGTFISLYTKGTSGNSGATTLPEYYGSFLSYEPGSNIP